MGLFGKKRGAASGGGGRMQPPDEFAQQAQLAYGVANFVGAANAYWQAIDKLHTMYVIGGCTYRQPGPQDGPILEGIVNSIGAALAMDDTAPVRDLPGRSVGYLEQIASVADQSGEGGRYRTAIAELVRY